MDGTNELVTRMITSEWRNEVASWRVVNEKEDIIIRPVETQ